MSLGTLARIRIVLVQPAGPLNLGAVARVMRNMELEQLVLVNPHCDPTAAAARHMAVHGGPVLAAARIVDSLPEALAGCQRAIATTGRLHPQDHPLEPPEVALPWLLPPEPSLEFEAALIFGPEDRGLSNEELSYAQRWIRIPSSPTYPSLNLGQAVAVCAYLLHRLAQEPSPEVRPVAPMVVESGPAERADLEQVEGFFQDLESLLLKIGYLYPHTTARRMAKLRRLLHRTGPNSQELAMLRGILRQVNWALKSDPNAP
jgi:tRNA/rRNA methyltransferase